MTTKNSHSQEDIKMTKFYSNAHDDGREGRNSELTFRISLAECLGKKINVDRIKSAYKADFKVRTAGGKTVTGECKTGCGWLTKPCYTQEQAQTLLQDLQALKKAVDHSSYIAYAPTSADEMLIMPKSRFIEICAKHNILRIKKHSSGCGYGVTIQSYVPTPTFRASKNRYEAILNDLFDNGEYLDCWVDRLNIVEILEEEEA